MFFFLFIFVKFSMYFTNLGRGWGFWIQHFGPGSKTCRTRAWWKYAGNKTPVCFWDVLASWFYMSKNSLTTAPLVLREDISLSRNLVSDIQQMLMKWILLLIQLLPSIFPLKNTTSTRVHIFLFTLLTLIISLQFSSIKYPCLFIHLHLLQNTAIQINVLCK